VVVVNTIGLHETVVVAGTWVRAE